MALAVGEDLSPAETQELQRHLQDCSNCQQTWEQHRRGFAVLQHSRTNETRPKSDSVWPTVSHRLRERAAAPQLGEFNGWIAALAVTAACVLLFVFSIEDSTPVASFQQQGNNFDNNTRFISTDNSGQDPAPLLRRDGVRDGRSYNGARLPDRK
ncbi:MAG: zf-HC2 domain-containing protein [Planctomycetaceae bacterium]|nr:zf-HC2 domain-containing protein [Planctomycetaceae bacterium]